MISFSTSHVVKNYTWTDWKAISSNKDLVLQLSEDGQKYLIYGYDLPEVHVCLIYKGDVPQSVIDSGYSQEQNDTDKADFESDYKSTANDKIEASRDNGGAVVQTPKITQTGWIFHMHGFEFVTSKLNSVVDNDVSNTPYNMTTMKYYELLGGQEVEITGGNLNQTYLDANCIKTVVDWEPPYDYDIIGGTLRQRQQPTSDVYTWIVGVPDVPYQYGGSKVFISNLDLAYIDPSTGLRVDGRVAKFMKYDPNYHTNKFRLIFRHDAGFRHDLFMMFEIFKV